MDAALILPKKRKRARSGLNNRHLPSELLEEILLNLPQKSLLRFSTVSKPWNSMIFDPVFTRKHKNRAALLRRHRLVVYTNAYPYGVALISSEIRSLVTRERHDSGFGPVFSYTNIVDVRNFEGEPHLLAYCDELWCVRVNMSIFLWNPSMRNVARVPPPFSCTHTPDDFIYGLGYDSVNDDYKILKIGRFSPSTTELYSLKKKCWREIESVSSNFTPSCSQKRCEFVEGRFHWIGSSSAPVIASFDLSTEKYGEVALPHEYDDEEEECDDDDDEEDCDDDDDDEEDYDELDEVVTLNGKLCAYLNYDDEGIGEGRFVLWVMEEYGVEKSWTKKFDIMSPDLGNMCLSQYMLTPLYFFDNNNLLVKGNPCCAKGMCILMYRNGENARPRWKIVKGIDNEADAIFYVESLITVKISANTHIRFVE